MKRNPLAALALFSGFICCSLNAQTGTWVIDTLAGRDRPINDGGSGVLAPLNSPAGVVVDTTGNTIFSDSGNHRVRRISSTGAISTIAGNGESGNTGDGGPATSARLLQPMGLALDSAGNLYIADYAANVVRKVFPDGTITTVAGTGSPGNSGNGGKATAAALSAPVALAVDAQTTLYIAEDLNGIVRKVTADGNIQAFTTGRFSYPDGLAVDSNGNVYIAAWGENRIYKATPSGTTTVIAGTGSYGFTGDGAAATGAALAGPQGITADSSGNLWICDSGNNRIRRITPDGKIQTVVGNGGAGLNTFTSDPTTAYVYTPVGIALDSRGYVYWTESGNNRVRFFNTNNRQITEIAGTSLPITATGGPTSQLLFNPYSSAADAAGNLYIADTTNNVIRKITPAGVSSVVAGTGQASFNGEVGTATAVNLSAPKGVSVDAQGTIFIAESGSGRVRKVDSTGRISTVMGNGSGLPFSGTFAGNAFLFSPTGVVATGNGAFIVVDQIFGIAARVDSLGTISLIPTSAVNFLTFPAGIAASGSAVYIADTFNNRILKNVGNTTTVIAGTGALGYSGDGSSATRATFFFPGGVAVDAKENIYVADTGNNAIRMIDPAGRITTVAGYGQTGLFRGQRPRRCRTAACSDRGRC